MTRPRTIGDVGRASEVKTARRLGAKLRPASGATGHSKADMVVGCLLVEAKSTKFNSIQVELDWLLKVSSEARSEGKVPVVALTFTDGSGSPRRDGRWALVPESTLKDLGEVGRFKAE